ncbi:MAG: amidohydrolase family protein [Bryobacteraceae bacterium]
MLTPWGEFPISDAHVHLFSPAFFSTLASQSGHPVSDLERLLDWRIPATNPEAAAEWIAELDSRVIHRAALIASVPGDEGSVAEAVSLYPGRFHGYFMVNPLAPDGVERGVNGISSAKLHGVCLFPAMHRYSIQDPRLRPILEAAGARPGTIVFVHCGVLTVGVRRKLGLPCLFDMSYSNPIDLHAVAMMFPRVNFVIPHFGAGYFREALMLCDLCPNIFLDTSSSNSWTKYQPETLSLQTVFAKALNIAGPRRLLFGTDSSFFPRGWNAPVFESQVSILRDLGVGADDAQAILGGNLERLLAR